MMAAYQGITLINKFSSKTWRKAQGNSKRKKR